MTQDNNNNANLEVVARKLDALDARLRGAIDATRRKNTLATVVSVLIVVLMGIYLYVAYSQISTFDAEQAALVGKGRFDELLPEARAHLTQQLMERAPEVVDRAGQRMQELPDLFVDRLKGHAAREVEAKLPEVEQKVYTALSEAIQNQNPAAGDDEKRFQALLDGLGERAVTHVDNLQARYTSDSSDLIAYLDRLAEGQNLATREKHHREVFQKFLVLIKAYEAQRPAEIKTVSGT